MAQDTAVFLAKEYSAFRQMGSMELWKEGDGDPTCKNDALKGKFHQAHCWCDEETR